MRKIADLVAAGLIAPGDEAALAAAAARFAVAVPPVLADLIDRDDPHDPIRRQFVPGTAELADLPEDRDDPIGDAAYSPVAGLVHRYPDRVLLKPILVCPVYCRFCFRREQVGGGQAGLSARQIDDALAYVAANPAISEVIVTGGDPLMLSAARIKSLTEKVAAIAHVETLRWHSRVPVADPARVTPALVRALRPPPGMGVWLAIHVNHPRELSDPARAALGRLADGGIPLLGQTVLLRGVNDDAAVLESLFRALIRNRVKPYYLHHPDRARGTGHFRMTVAEGRALVRALRGRLSGIAQPTYVLDIPGGAGKVPIAPDYWDAGSGTVEDWNGERHRY